MRKANESIIFTIWSIITDRTGRGPYHHATHGQTIQQLTRKVFDRRDLVDWLPLGDGWLSLITGSDFSRGNIVKSFLRETSRE